MASQEDQDYYEPDGSYPIQSTFLFPLNWNVILIAITMAQQWMCVAAGVWGLFWYADMGDMMETCFTTGLQGGVARYIYRADYSSNKRAGREAPDLSNQWNEQRTIVWLSFNYNLKDYERDIKFSESCQNQLLHRSQQVMIIALNLKT